MFPPEILLTYLAAVLLVVIAPGPDNILAIGRGLSQGQLAAALSSIGAGLGIMVHSVAATLGLFVVAFVPQFVAVERGSVAVQMLVYGAISAVLTAIIFTLLGAFASQLSGSLARRPRVTAAANVGAGLTFIAAGLSILALQRRT